MVSVLTELAAARSRKDLMSVLTHKLKELYPITSFEVTLINEGDRSHSPFLVDHGVIAAQNYAVIDGVFGRAMASEEPVMFDDMLVVALRAGGYNIGFVILRFDDRERINVKSALLKEICALLAVKLSQILAYEEIEKRELEKSMLLAFSNAMASERDRTELAKILKLQLKVLFHIEDYAIHALGDDKKSYVPILFDPDSHLANHPDPTGIALRLGHEVIGILNFRQDTPNQYIIQQRLFKSICSQLAITLANIIANEKVGKQLSEIKMYKEQLEAEKSYLTEEIEATANYSEIIGESQDLKKVFRMIAQVAYTDSTVLLLGETGTGKELVARAIHNSSPRKNKLMVKVNCAAIPANLIESELFGHERGSFTGAVERRIGKFELANNGTLFLDEIGEMMLDVQVKLLRALQEREIERVGGKGTIKTNVRIIAATNRDLEKLMAEGKFRSDLYYRLNTFPISIPPLRSRKDDIPILALNFMDRYSKKTGKKIKSISNKVLKELMEYDWPGNVRELEHLIERSVLLATGDSINEIHLPNQKRNLPADADKDNVVIRTMRENEKDYILMVLNYVNGRIGGKGGAAELLGLPTSTLNSKIKKLGIKKKHI